MVSSFYGLVSPKSWMGGGSQISNNSRAITVLDIRARRSENISLFFFLHPTLTKWPMKLITLISRKIYVRKTLKRLAIPSNRRTCALQRHSSSLSASVHVDARHFHTNALKRGLNGRTGFGSPRQILAKFAHNATCQSGGSLACSPAMDGESGVDISYWLGRHPGFIYWPPCISFGTSWCLGFRYNILPWWKHI